MKVPVIVLSGFLGSGKTTLLLRLIEEAKQRGLQPGILMNELGKYDVDGHIISDFNPGMVVEKLLDGCICCSKKGELAGSIASLLLRSPDVIFIELTGVANPEEIADALTEPELIGKVALHRIVTILDAENFLDYNSIFASDRALVHTLARQMEVADHIVINKIDLVSPPQLTKIDKAVHKQNQKAAIAHSMQSLIDLEPLFIGLRPTEKLRVTFRPFKTVKATPKETSTYHGHTHDHHRQDETKSFSRVQSVVFTVPTFAAITSERIEQLMQRWNGKLLRAKGYLPSTPNGAVQLMQYAGKQLTWTSSPYSGQPYIVFIGLDLNTDKLAEEWSRMANI
jgi:G3E family GTPase